MPILIVIIVVAGIGWVMTRKNKLSVPQTTEEGGSQTPFSQETKKGSQQGEEFSGSLKAAIALGVPMKCSLEGGNYSGTGYIKGKKYYGEVNTNGQTVHIIMKDNCMWTWQPNSNQGMKNCFDNENALWGDQQNQQNQQNNNIHCVPAIISDSKFNPPANLKFPTYDEPMQQSMQQSEE